MEFNCKRCAHETHCRLICMETDEFPPHILCSRFQVYLNIPLLDESDKLLRWTGRIYNNVEFSEQERYTNY